MVTKIVFFVLLSTALGVALATHVNDREAVKAANMLKKEYLKTLRVLLGEEGYQHFVETHPKEVELLGK